MIFTKILNLKCKYTIMLALKGPHALKTKPVQF